MVFKKRTGTGRRWRRLFVLFIVLALLLGITQWRRAQISHAVNDQRQVRWSTQVDSQFYTEDVVVAEGERLDHDVVVYTGDVDVQTGGSINGDLVVYSGDVTVAEFSEVQGGVTALSGDAEIGGAIGGDLVVLSGDIKLTKTAVIGGNLSVMKGEIDREPGAVVRGNLLHGDFKLPPLPQFPPLLEALQIPAVPAPAVPPIETTIAHSQNFGGALLHLLGRLLGAAFGTSLIILLTGLVYYVRPNWVQTVQQTLHQQRPLSFAVGLVVNLVLTFMTALLLITLCLAPVGLAAGLLFAAINLVGLSALSLTVGDWLLRRVKLESQPLLALLVGACLLTGLLALGWAIGGCLRPLAYMTSLLVTSFGGGAVVVYWLRLRATPKGDTTIVSV